MHDVKATEFNVSNQSIGVKFFESTKVINERHKKLEKFQFHRFES